MHIRTEVFVSNNGYASQPLTNDMPPDTRASFAATDSRFIRPIDWYDSDNNTLWYKCANVKLHPEFFIPCVIDTSLVRGGNPRYGPYYMHAWGWKSSGAVEYAIRASDGVYAVPWLQILDPTGTFPFGDPIQLAPPSPFSDGLNVFSLSPDNFRAIVSALNQSPSISLAFYIQHKLTGPSLSWNVYQEPINRNIAMNLSSSILTGQITPQQYQDLLCAGLSSIRFCDCAADLKSITNPGYNLTCPVVCECIDPGGANMKKRNSWSCLKVGVGADECNPQ